MSDPVMELVDTTCQHQKGKLTAGSVELTVAAGLLGPEIYEKVWRIAFLAGASCGTEIAKMMFKGEL